MKREKNGTRGQEDIEGVPDALAAYGMAEAAALL